MGEMSQTLLVTYGGLFLPVIHYVKLESSWG